MNIAIVQARHKDRAVDPGMARTEGGHVSLMAGGIAVATNNPADAPSTVRRPFNINAGRVQAIEVLIAHRYGGPCTIDDWSSYLSVGLNAVALRAAGNGRRATPQMLTTWAAEWLPTAPHDFVVNLAEKVAARPRKMTARKAGELLAVREVEWRALDLKTLHPVDVSPEAIEAEQRAKRAAAERQRRAAQREARGGQTRAEYIASSVAELARKEGVTPKTIHARRRAERQGDRLRGDNSKCVSIKGTQPETLPSRPLLSDDTRRAAKARLCDAAIAAFSTTPASSAPPLKAAR